MSDGIRRARLKSNLYIKAVALARGRVLLPMRALNSIGKFADRRLTLLWIGARVAPKLRLADILDHFHMSRAVGPGIRFQARSAVLEVPIDSLIPRVTDFNDERRHRGLRRIAPRRSCRDSSIVSW
jgi:hypothetical protein